MRENFPRPNKLSPTCELAGFLAYWLSCVVLPSSKQADSVRVSVSRSQGLWQMATVMQ